MSEEINWHSHGMAWVLADSADPSGPEEWTAGCLARAYEAGAKQAQAVERERCAKVAESRPLHSGMDEWDSTAAAIRGA